MTKVIPIGARVRFTAKFLKSTGQYSGKEARSKWQTLMCSCGLCTLRGHVRVNEEHSEEYARTMWTVEELTAEPSLRYRHIAIANLEVCK